MLDMLNVSIDPALKAAAPQLALGVLRASVQVKPKDDELWQKIDGEINDLRSKLSLDAISEQPNVRALRTAYRKLGKDPARFRGSQEALLRRILKGQGLYQINTVVDINNLISLRSRHSVGSYNFAQLAGPITFRMGQRDENYKGIGKDVVDLSNLPVFADSAGPFGSPTSDSERAMITLETSEIMMVIIAFSGCDGLAEHLNFAAHHVSLYAARADAIVERTIVQ